MRLLWEIILVAAFLVLWVGVCRQGDHSDPPCPAGQKQTCTLCFWTSGDGLIFGDCDSFLTVVRTGCTCEGDVIQDVSE